MFSGQSDRQAGGDTADEIGPRCWDIVMRSSFQASDVTVAIPTYGREGVLLDTIRACLEPGPHPAEVLVVDQTPQHEPETAAALRELVGLNQVRVVRREWPSQPAAMNCALCEARTPLVLFLDDDVIPSDGFVAEHARAHGDDTVWAVVGQIIQPWQTPEDVPCLPRHAGLRADFDFPFHSTRSRPIRNLMSGHVSVRREKAIEVGGFDENFMGAAYRFDTEFGRRLIRAGGSILFWPAASLQHLRVQRGGTRVGGNHLTSVSPHHGVGDYYFALLHGWHVATARYMARRMIREVCTRFHVRHPWWIPVKLTGEIRAFVWAWRLARRGQKLIGA